MGFAEIISAVTALISAIGLVITGLGVVYVGRQLAETRRTAVLSQKIARNDFLLHLQERNDKYDQIHIRLRGAGWPDNRNRPDTSEEWLEVARYMGHLETLQLLLDDNILDIETIDRLYSHRIYNVVKNEAIYEEYLEKNAINWQDFNKLRKTLSVRGKVYSCLAAPRASNNEMKT